MVPLHDKRWCFSRSQNQRLVEIPPPVGWFPFAGCTSVCAIPHNSLSYQLDSHHFIDIDIFQNPLPLIHTYTNFISSFYSSFCSGVASYLELMNQFVCSTNGLAASEDKLIANLFNIGVVFEQVCPLLLCNFFS